MPALPSLRPATRAVLMLVASIGFWSSNVVIVRAMGDAISPWLLSWLRWVIALAVALPLLWPAVRAAWPRLYANRRPLLWLAFSGFVANTVFLYVGLSDTTATNAAGTSAKGSRDTWSPSGRVMVITPRSRSTRTMRACFASCSSWSALLGAVLGFVMAIAFLWGERIPRGLKTGLAERGKEGGEGGALPGGGHR